jgi:hypothetical protein
MSLITWPPPTAYAMLPVLDPEPPPRPVGDLLLYRCDGCGGPAAVRDYYVGPVMCAGCWARRHGVNDMRPVVPTGRRRERRYAGGAEPSPSARVDSYAPSGRTGSHPGRALGTPAYRILIPAPPARIVDATPSQIPPGAATLLAAASLAGRTGRVTYSLAEERATGRLVHGVAVRLQQDGRAVGFAVWHNGASKGGQWRGVPRLLALGELTALAAGRPYEPPPARPEPPRGPCPRCGAAVRWRVDTKLGPVPWKHKRAGGGEGERAAKMDCA